MSKSLRLVLDINYEENGAAAIDIADNLMCIVSEAVGDGLVTQELPAELNRWQASVYQEPLPLPPCGVILSRGEDYGHGPQAAQLEGADGSGQG